MNLSQEKVPEPHVIDKVEKERRKKEERPPVQLDLPLFEDPPKRP